METATEYVLSSLTLSLNTYGANAGKLTGTVCYRDKEYKTNMTLNLDPHETAQLIDLMRDRLISALTEQSEAVRLQLATFVTENK